MEKRGRSQSQGKGAKRHHGEENLGMGTLAIHAGQHSDEFGSAAPAIFQTSTFKFANAAQGAARFGGKEEGYIYTRLGNPTIKMLEDNIATLEGGHRGLATASGMAASNTVLFTLLGQGKHIVCSEAVYGPVRVSLEKQWVRYGVEVTFVDTTNLAAVKAAIKSNTAVVYIETPCNPTLAVTDLKAVGEIAHANGALLVVDNTFMSPILQRPLSLGADVVVHSITKFLNGHSDVVGGMIIPKDADLYKQIKPHWTNLGGTMDPHQAWLVIRGLKTLKLRVLAAQENAIKVAKFLEDHPAVKCVFYPGLDSHPQKKIHAQQSDGPGSLISFEMKTLEAGVHLLNNLHVITLAVSLGGIESLIQQPAAMTHCGIAKEDRLKAGITDGLIRFSVGCEDYEDIIADLKKPLDELI